MSAETGCWVWTAYRDRDGYGVVSDTSNRGRRAHRAVYELHVGPIPEGLQLDHLCRNTGCVNPAHLEPVTCRVNLLRGDTVNARNAQKTHCKRGHEFTPENTGRQPRGRYCRTCSRLCARRREEAASQP